MTDKIAKPGRREEEVVTAQERTIEQISQELAEASQAESNLAEEANSTKGTLKAAAGEDRGALQKAALSGSSLKASSPLTKARQRAEELPSLIWAARLRRLELKHEYEARRAEEADTEKRATVQELSKLEEERRELEERMNDAREVMHAANNEWRDYNAAKGQTRRALAALEHQGPHFDMLKTSPLRPRP